MMKRFIYCLLLALLGTNICAESIIIEHSHINEITEDNDAAYEPVGIRELQLEEENILDGVVKRFEVSYAKITRSQTGSTYTVRKDDENVYNLTSEDADEYFKNNLQFDYGHVVSIEYFITQNLSIELADTYRSYQMDGRNVGQVDESFLTSPSQNMNDYEYKERLHDIRVGVQYAIKIIDTPQFRFEVSPGMSAGVIHLNSKVNYSQFGESKTKEYFNDFAGYSYGVSIEAKAVFWDNFYISVGAESRQYIMAPMEHESGFSQQIDQDGFNVYFGLGVRF